MLIVDGVDAGYGEAQILFGMSLTVNKGVVVTLLGRNGMGKTTTLRTVMGLLRPRSGRISFLGSRIDGEPAHVVARGGIGFVPEGRQTFVTLTVEENLVATAAPGRGTLPPWTLPRIYALFPVLKERRRQFAGTLSGGEQQMLAIGRALMTNPVLLILDEATEGLAPLVREAIWTCLRELKSAGLSILLVDRNVDALMRLADRHYVVEKGRVTWVGTSEELEASRVEIERRVGV